MLQFEQVMVSSSLFCASWSLVFVQIEETAVVEVAVVEVVVVVVLLLLLVADVAAATHLRHVSDFCCCLRGSG